MIDTIKFMVEGVPDRAYLRSKLDDYEDVFNRTYQVEKFRGRLRNMKLNWSYDQLKINGSLNRYFQGSNVHEFTRSSPQLCVKALSAR